MAIQEPMTVDGAPSIASWSMRQTIAGYVELTKPRIMLLLLYTGLCGMVVASHGAMSLRALIGTMAGLVLSTGGSAALNMWYDRDIDGLMKRTRNRPLPRGIMSPRSALIYGIVLVVASFVELDLVVNALTAFLAVFGAFYYVVIYTIWLKRRTPQNIVIGGGAGAFPPIIGAAGVVGHVPWSAIVLFLIIFFWTPPHFWSLAVYKNDEYKRAQIPMMPVVKGEKRAKIESVLYAVLLTILTFVLPLTAKIAWEYEVVISVLAAVFLYLLIRSWKEPQGVYEYARKSFFFSILYLFVFCLSSGIFSLI